MLRPARTDDGRKRDRQGSGRAKPEGARPRGLRFHRDSVRLLRAVRGAKGIVVLEEHFLAGGLGSAVCEVLCDHGCGIPVRRLGLPMEAGYCYRYGGREVILRHYGLGEKQIRKQIVDFCARRAGK